MAYVAPHNSLTVLAAWAVPLSTASGVRRPAKGGWCFPVPFLQWPCSGLVRPLRRLSAARPCGGLRKAPFLPVRGSPPGLGTEKRGLPPSWLSTLVRISSLAAAFAAYHPNPASGRKPALGVRPEHAGPLLLRGQSLNAHRPQPSFSDGHRHDAGRGTRTFGKVRLHACAPAAGYPPPGNGASGYCFFPLLNA